MDALTFYNLARGYKHINAFAATVQSAHETGNWTSYLWLNAYNGAGENSKTINTEGELILTIDYRA